MSSKLCPFCMRMTQSETCPHCGKNVNYTGLPMHLPAGYVVSGRHPYVLGAALGQGGFGITYIALDMVTRTRVAIKEYYPTFCSARTGDARITAYSSQEDVYQKGKERFLNEARTLKSLSDLNSIVNVLDFFEANNTAYLVMEFLDGRSLKDYAAKYGKFPAQKFLSRIKPLMADIQRMHERGVIHRDIAPDNIILLSDGQMKLIDFGAARSYVGDKSMTVVVKKGFAPVEQYLSKGSSTATDVYALAATIYYCITGKVPPDSAERQYDSAPLPPPSSLDADITSQQERALSNALQILQNERTQSVQEFLDELSLQKPVYAAPFLSDTGKTSKQDSRISSRKLWIWIASTAAVLLLVLIVLLFLLMKDPGRDVMPTDTSSPEMEAVTETTAASETTETTASTETEAPMSPPVVDPETAESGTRAPAGVSPGNDNSSKDDQEDSAPSGDSSPGTTPAPTNPPDPPQTEPYEPPESTTPVDPTYEPKPPRDEPPIEEPPGEEPPRDEPLRDEPLRDESPRESEPRPYNPQFL